MGNKMSKHGIRALTSRYRNNLVKSKRSQITIFIIVAILLVVAILLIFTLLKEPLRIFTQTQTQEPNQEIEQCVKKSAEKASELLIEHAGYIQQLELTKSVGYNLGEVNEIPLKNYTYLCYTSMYRIKCTASEAIVIDNIKQEIRNYITQKINSCFLESKNSLEKEGYNVVLQGNMNFSVELVPRAMIINIDRKMEIKKAGQIKKFEDFVSRTTSPIYDFAIISHEIVSQESIFCNSEYLNIMKQNKNFQITKFQTGDGNKIYSIEDEISGKVFRFLIRGCVLPTPS